MNAERNPATPAADRTELELSRALSMRPVARDTSADRLRLAAVGRDCGMNQTALLIAAALWIEGAASFIASARTRP